MTLVVASIVQGGCTFMAVMIIEAYAKEHRAELAAYPRDEEVYQADMKAVEKALATQEVAQWEKVPGFRKAILLIAATLMHFANLSFFAVPKKLFQTVRMLVLVLVVLLVLVLVVLLVVLVLVLVVLVVLVLVLLLVVVSGVT